MEKTDAFVDTFSGQRLDVPVPKPSQIKIVDIAHSLSMQCRFTGHTRVFYSVGEHSVRGARLVGRKHQLAFLLHDGSEAYMADINRPMKQFLPDYLAIEEQIQAVIYEAFGITNINHGVIKKADNIMGITEARDLMPTTEGWLITEVPDPLKICPWPQQQAQAEFLIKYRELTK